MSETKIKPAHIIYPSVEVGEKAMTLCGKRHKVTIKQQDIPENHPSCQDCVTTAVLLLTEADSLVFNAQRRARLVADMLARTIEGYEDSALKAITKEADEYQTYLAKKADEKARIQAKVDKQVAKSKKKK